jgi:hypothetical protein
MTSIQSDTAGSMALLGVGATETRDGNQSVARSASETANLVDLWGDTVNLRHLGISLAVSVPISLGTFLLFVDIFAGLVAQPQISRAYAMLAGLVACLVTGAISARLFKPKRVITEEASDPVWRASVLAELQNERGGVGEFSDLSEATIRELEALGLKDFFQNAESNRKEGVA